MNEVSGKVIHRESGLGIPDLLVVVFDADPQTRSEDPIEGGAPTITIAMPPIIDTGIGDRLCTLITGPDGGFKINYENSEFQIRNEEEKRPDLLLMVMAPDDADREPQEQILFTSETVRSNAGLVEQYIIRITTDQLLKASVPLPSQTTGEAESPASLIGRQHDAIARTAQIADGSVEVAKVAFDAHRARFAGFRDTIAPALGQFLSNVPGGVHDNDRFVAPGESVFAKSTAIISKGLSQVVNSDDPVKRAPIRGLLTLTDAQRDALRAAATGGTVSRSEVHKIAASNRLGPVTTFVERRQRRLPSCSPQTAAEASADALLNGTAHPSPTTSTTPPPVVVGNGVVTFEEADVSTLIARLMDTMTSPEEVAVVGLTPTASRASVQQSVQELSFQPSPADVPAFHDFNSLQIAFQHVWQEAIDQGVLNLAQDAYETIVELGGDPGRDEHKALPPTEAILTEGRTAMRAMRRTGPIVHDHRSGSGGGDPWQPSSYTPPPLGSPDAGVVVTGNIRDHRTGSSDPGERLPALLIELNKRLKEKYTFTTYAANTKERSVNFGILNTFRQIWEPLAYQAGPLVKSIPLAPKQTQKVVVTRKTSKKRSEKEVENNLRVLKEETSQTTRAEREITQKASTKTSFQYTNTATGNEGVASDTSTTTMSQEAARSTDDVKKSYHEAVFKAAQEYKQERTTEITTETVEEFETSETTEICNPNDEIAVTFLFYELQRRYRVTERLYRVRPVVLVAQEMPQPHEIDLDWLVAHDWILKRAILDDSFVPALTSICECAGKESALREMQANVSQQRKIVEELRNEIAIAQNRADVQSGLLDQGIFHRTGVSHQGLVSGLVSELGGAAGKVSDLLFGGGGGGGNNQTMEDAAQRAADQVRDLLFRLEREVTALNALMETYGKALREYHTGLIEIARLQVHIKENILYYMQAIWNHEPPDQRFFRLHMVPVPIFDAQTQSVKVDFDHPVPSRFREPHRRLPRFDGVRANIFEFEATTKVNDQLTEFAPLAEVADLDTPLGYKGNYMIFPLRQSNSLTDFMMDPFVDRATGELIDPSETSNWTMEEFAEYVSCLQDSLTEEEFDELRDELRDRFRELLTDPNRDDDVLVVPTDSLFIEALPAEHSLIERFKREHRMIDVKSAQEDLRSKGLESLRKAARLLADQYEDPNIDHRVLIQGAVPGIAITPPEH